MCVGGEGEAGVGRGVGVGGGGGERETKKEDGTGEYRKPKGSERSSHRQTARTRKRQNLRSACSRFA